MLLCHYPVADAAALIQTHQFLSQIYWNALKLVLPDAHKMQALRCSPAILPT